MLDYYVISARAGAGEPSPSSTPSLPGSPPRLAGIVVEEFVLTDDGTATGLNNAVWTPEEGAWWSSAAFSRAMRTDPRVRNLIVAVSRPDAEAAFHQLGSGELPSEAALRSRFHDRLTFDGSPPLRLSPPEVPEGFHDKRVYRILFANDLGEAGLARLLEAWRMRSAGPSGGRVVGTARLRVEGDLFTWDLRRLGAGAAWCVDLTACLASPAGDAIVPLLRELITTARFAGLIPVTVERFS